MNWWQEQRQIWSNEWSGVFKVGSWALRAIGRLTAYGALFLLLFVFRPSADVFATPLAKLTLGSIIHTVAIIGAAVVLVASFFTPSETPEAREGWKYVGILVLLSLSALVLYLHSQGDL